MLNDFCTNSTEKNMYLLWGEFGENCMKRKNQGFNSLGGGDENETGISELRNLKSLLDLDHTPGSTAVFYLR